MKLKDYIENFEESLLKEVTGTGITGGFTGRGGQDIDDLFAGGFHPDFGDIAILLQKQLDADLVKRLFTDDTTPIGERDFIDLAYDYKYDNTLKIDKSKFKSTSDTEMQVVDLEINYDKIKDNSEENKKFINDTSDWKSIYDNKKY